MGKMISVLTPAPIGNSFKKVREKMPRENVDHFDDNFPEGVFVIPKGRDESRIKVRSLYNYCREQGIKPEELSTEELEKFLDR